MKSHLLVALIAADVAFSIVSIAFATLPLPLSFLAFYASFFLQFCCVGTAPFSLMFLPPFLPFSL
jgi:hypothetical protein